MLPYLRLTVKFFNFYGYRLNNPIETLLQDKEKIIKDFYFYNNADEMKKKVFSKPLIFFSEKEHMTVDGDIGYIGCRCQEQRYHSSWVKRTKTLTRFTEVDFIITMMSGSYILMSHLFSCKITACKATSHWRQNKLSATNVF